LNRDLGPWSVYVTRTGRYYVTRHQRGRAGLVALFLTKEDARQFAREENGVPDGREAEARRA